MLQKALPGTPRPDLMVKPGLSASSPDSTALDAIREALQLLESVKPEAQDKDRRALARSSLLRVGRSPLFLWA